MQRLILKNSMSPGDIVMLTAAVRDLHRCYPGRFLTDARTSCAELWDHNPYLTPLNESDPEVEVIECAYPSIDRANEAPCHCLHGFIEFLNDRLGLEIRPTEFRGHVPLSELEKSWYSQVHELIGEEAPFWIVAAGGKYDVTVKWWAPDRYQRVVDHFRGKIQFVQVGEAGHHHPRLNGVIDLRGQTSLRELVRLVHHAQGVLCPVTALMHLAAAVEVKGGAPPQRPCVIVAGGREPVHWEAYPGHQFIHTIGAHDCCSGGGCWRDRVRPLGDGDERDGPGHLCVAVAGDLPRCMDLITAEEVIRRIELFFAGGLIQYLDPGQARAARRGVAATAANPYDQGPLNLSNLRPACERFLREKRRPYPGNFSGRGIVVCAGGVRYFTNAWVCLRMLRRAGCALPIEFWSLDETECDPGMRRLVEPYGVEWRCAAEVRRRHPARRLCGWGLKAFALVHSRFREILLLDADNVPVANPEFLFDSAPYLETGAIFWPDVERSSKADPVWFSCGLERPEGAEFESGQIVVDKQRCWEALGLALWFNEQADFLYQHLLGDKDTFQLAFGKLGQPCSLVPHPVHALEGTMCQHDFAGRRLFQHRNLDKWNLFLRNRAVGEFWFEDECRAYVRELQQLWDGRSGRFARIRARRRGARPVRLTACLITCAERAELREQTLRRLATTDWGDEPVLVPVESSDSGSPVEPRPWNARLALERALENGPEYVLFIEDGVEFNRYLRHNLERWLPLTSRSLALAGLDGSNLCEIACDVRSHFLVVAPEAVFSSQALLISRAACRFLVDRWEEAEGSQTIRISRLAARLGRPIYCHAPALVRRGTTDPSEETFFPRADDFDPGWKNPASH